MNTIKCPACLSENNREVEKKEIYILRFCADCALKFWTPLGHPGKDFYETSDLHEISGVRKLQWRHKQFLKNPPLSAGSILDIGCGPAEFLNECKKIGFNVLGADIASRNIEEAKRRFGIEVVEGGALEVAKKYPNRKFDIVTFFEVLEHLANPISFFKEIKAILRPGGYIVMSVPNANRFGHLFEKEENPPNHLLRWNSFSLHKFLISRGFTEVQIKEQLISYEYPMIKGWFSYAYWRNYGKNQTGVILSRSSKNHRKDGLIKKVIKKCRNIIAPVFSAVIVLPLQVLGIKYWDMYAVARKSE